jgi:hypothetical protein
MMYMLLESNLFYCYFLLWSMSLLFQKHMLSSIFVTCSLTLFQLFPAILYHWLPLYWAITQHRPKNFQILYFPFLPTGLVAPFAYSNVLSMWWAFILWQHQFIRCNNTMGLVLLITVLRNGLLLLIVWV